MSRTALYYQQGGPERRKLNNIAVLSIAHRTRRSVKLATESLSVKEIGVGEENDTEEGGEREAI